MNASIRFRSFLTLLTITAVALLVGTMVVTPPVAIHGIGWLLLGVYALMLIVVQSYPIQIGSQSINIALGIELPMFLQFGPIITFAGMLIAWFISKAVAGKQIKVTRVVASFGMYTIMLTGASAAYRAAGGPFPMHFQMPLTSIAVPVLFFIIVHLLLNYFITYSYMLSLGKLNQWVRGIYWDLVAFVIEVVTLWILLFFLHVYGVFSIFYIAIPFAVILYVFRLYYDLVLSNRQLALINQVTAKLSVKSDEKELLTTLVEGTVQLVDTVTCYFFGWNEDKQVLFPMAVHGPSGEIEAQMFEVVIQPHIGVTGLAFSKRQTYLQRKHNEIPTKGDYDTPTSGASILAVPIVYQDMAMGVLTLTHEENNAYTKRDQEMVQILATNASIVLWNLRRFERTEERNYIDDLTGLYNYRYFEKIIPELCQSCAREMKGLVLLVLDIDHFKHINDTYGHLAGNEVLKGIATLLKEMVREMDVVCRYGGEEFTVILPGASLEIGKQIAERLRKAVENTSITLPPVGQVHSMPVRITVSVGVASYPDMGDSPLELLRLADRAMYVGSKQNGRNRVAVYERQL